MGRPASFVQGEGARTPGATRFRTAPLSQARKTASAAYDATRTAPNTGESRRNPAPIISRPDPVAVDTNLVARELLDW
jgi:hypothetical protein